MCFLFIAVAILSDFFSLPGLILSIFLALYPIIQYKSSRKKIAVEHIDWTKVDEFERNYDESKQDYSGCYVILSFPLPVTNNDYSHYETAYVGSSSNINKEIHKVINNKTLSRVYKDLQEGKILYLSIHPVEMSEIDKLQEKLIDQYHAVPYLLSFKEVREKEKVR